MLGPSVRVFRYNPGLRQDRIMTLEERERENKGQPKKKGDERFLRVEHLITLIHWKVD